MSAACSVGLLLAVGLTVAHNGQLLMMGCNNTEVSANARSPVAARCPFDNTKIYVSQALGVVDIDTMHSKKLRTHQREVREAYQRSVDKLRAAQKSTTSAQGLSEPL